MMIKARISLLSAVIVIVVLAASCGVEPPSIPALPTITGPSGESAANTSAPSIQMPSITIPPVSTPQFNQPGSSEPEGPPLPAPEVAIYNKSFDWPPANPDDWVMSPSVIGFGWNLDHDPNRAAWIHRWGASFVSEISLWNHDSWRKVSDLPPEMAGAYLTDVDGNVVYSQEMLYLNLMHPAFRDWLKGHVRFELDHGADGFVIDEISGTAEAPYMGAGLDEYNLAGFGAYLADKYTASELSGKGVTSTKGFDYRAFLESRNLLDDYGRGGFQSLPLGQDYHDYLYRESQKFIVELIDYARSYASQMGRDIVITSNFTPLYDAEGSIIDEKLDYFSFEHAYYYSDWRTQLKNSGYPIAPAIRYANSRTQDAVVLLAIPDYGWLEKTGEPAATRLVQHAFAETYANLGYFCYFDLDYGFIGNTYAADHARLRPYYAFLREHPEVFNGLERRPEAAVVMPPHHIVKDYGQIDGTQGAAWVLGESNVDYTVIDVSQPLDTYELLVVQGYSWSDAEVAKLMTYMENGGNVIAIDSRFASRDENYNEVSRPALAKLKKDGRHAVGQGSFTFFNDYVGWKYYAELDKTAFKKIADAAAVVTAANTAPDGVQVIPYYSGGNIVIHVLNDNFSGGDFTRLSDLEITVNLPAGFDLAGDSLTVLSPDSAAAQQIPCTRQGAELSFTLPSLYIWSVVSGG